MGAWVLASVFYACFVLTEGQSSVGTTRFTIQPIPVRLARHAQGIDATKGLLVGGGIHSAVPIENNPVASATNYEPYDVKYYKFSAEDAKNPSPYVYNYNNEIGSYENGVNYNEFTSIEAEAEGYSQNLDTAYEHYKTATSFTLEGPKQLETITTHSFHKESEPFDVSGFQNSHKEDEEHAEVHYHQHKHLHKHNHRQEHMHKHEQKHKHEHGHDHGHQAQHEHKHESHHKHAHKSDHKHVHKGEHRHSHHQEHKHSHQGSHKHEHKHQQEHNHGHHHGHKHSHHGEHKHSHHNEHKHDHHHGHKHENKHQHKHEHHGQHKHHHGHKDEHKHQHHGSHHHKHSHHKH
ncbi:uncharacterized histidine-rich protein DDB_G0274557-like [Anoplophora glabripennis]|uniref:uncharacterized histidine-rich protein DDB_G0274557-like n=1 Tax=Anoplophora glabripennis TaxID=217634 RepID=UPI00087380EE|nr:uncharacterized histidine-rich protein DDB_G0274557-like [Anoplophora glabripennis]